MTAASGSAVVPVAGETAVPVVAVAVRTFVVAVPHVAVVPVLQSSAVTFVEIAAVETVSHSVSAAYASVIERAPFVPAVSSIMVPTVSSTVCYVYVRTSEIEIIAPRIT